MAITPKLGGDDAEQVIVTPVFPAGAAAIAPDTGGELPLKAPITPSALVGKVTGHEYVAFPDTLAYIHCQIRPFGSFT